MSKDIFITMQNEVRNPKKQVIEAVPLNLTKYYVIEYWGNAALDPPVEEELPVNDTLIYLEKTGQFDFWKAPEEDIYTLKNGKVVK